MSLQALIGELDAGPTVVSTDLEAAVEFIDALTDVVGTVRRDVFVDRAVMELTNSAGYLVGSIVFDGETDLYRFVPYDDGQDKEN